MNVRAFVRNQMFGVLLGAAAVAAPVGALYALGATGTAPAAATQPAPVVPAPATGNPNAVLPDFSTMVQKYGPAVVNISVVSKVPTSYNPGDQGDSGDDDDDDSGQGSRVLRGKTRSVPIAPLLLSFAASPCSLLRRGPRMVKAPAS